MTGERRYRRWFRVGVGRADAERELDEEIEAHLAMRTEELIRAGWSPRRAREEAVRRFGDLAQARRRLRASARVRRGRLRRAEWLDGARRDVRLALRQARRSPGFSVLALLTLALGIGLTTVMYTMVDRVLLRPLPFPDSDRLVALLSVDSSRNEFPQVSMANWMDWREQSRSLAATALLMDQSYTVAIGGESVRVDGQLIAGEFFDVLRPAMVAGRGFTADEVESGSAVAVVSEAFWRRHMGAAPLPGAIVVDGWQVDVVGVVAAATAYPERAQLWLPSALRRRTGDARNWINWAAVGRLRAGVDVAAARAELSAIADGIRSSDPAGVYSWGVGVEPLRERMVGAASGSLLLLLGAVTFVLLVACANLAGLGLARASSRLREVALRVAIGAGRGRVLRQLVTEVLVLAVAGGVLGVALAWLATRAIVARYGDAIPRSAEIGLDARVLAVALVATLAAGLLAAIAPAVRASRASLRTLIGGERTAVRGGRNLPGAALVCAEVALALLLLTGGALLFRSLMAVVAQDLGYEPEGVVLADIALAPQRYADDAARRLAFWRELLDRVRALPGVESAAVANWVPAISGGATFLEVEGISEGRPGAGYHVVSDDYFRTLRVPLLRGRTFDDADRFGSERVAVVDRAFAERFWPGADAIGRRVRAFSMENEVEGGAPWIRIIGVVGNVRQWGHERAPGPEMYVLHRQLHVSMTRAMSLIARAAPGAGRTLPRDIRAVVTAIDPALAPELSYLEDGVDRILLERRATTTLLGAFALLALLLAAIGIYGLISFAVAQRTREIGVRAALGARPSGLVGLMLGGALRVTLIGVALGAIGAFWLGRLIAGMLFDVAPADPLAFLAAAGILVAVATAAALVPAWRAARMDPLAALRET